MKKKITFSFPSIGNPIKAWSKIPQDGKLWIIFIVALFVTLGAIELINR